MKTNNTKNFRKAKRDGKTAHDLHKDVPPNWYHRSIRVDPLQRLWHKIRFKTVSALVEPTGGKILDIGCADGTFSKVIFDKSKADELIGIDVLKDSIEWARKHWKSKKMKFIVGDAHDLKFKDESFDAIFVLEVLEHIYSPEKLLKKIKRMLKKGGYAVFLVPSDSLLFRTVWFLWLNFYPRGWAWRDTHIQTYRNNYLTKISKKVGFRVEVDKKYNLGMMHLIKVRKK